VVAIAAAVVAGGAASAYASGPAEVTAIEVLSNRADLVSGGDALVALELARGVSPASIRVTLNGGDVTDDFGLRENGRYEGLVTDLAVGRNVMVARGRSGRGRRLTITNHPIGGPIFAGPQVTPWICNTNASTPPLGEPIDAQCNAPTRVDFLYRDLAGQFSRYDPANPPPAAAIQQTTTDAGETVPFIVQRVTGTADRGIYQIAVLVDPSKPIAPGQRRSPGATSSSTRSAAAAAQTTPSEHRATSYRPPTWGSASPSPPRASTPTSRTATTSSRPRRR
jgi:hypothetical protein